MNPYAAVANISIDILSYSTLWYLLEYLLAVSSITLTCLIQSSTSTRLSSDSYSSFDFGMLSLSQITLCIQSW